MRKRQPDGGSAGLGTSPSSTIRLRLPRWFGDSIGTAESSACVYGCIGVLVDLVPRPDLDDLAEVHDRDPVGDVADDGEVVRDEQVGEAEVVLEAREQVDDLRLDRDVERGDRLVEHDHRRVERQRAGDADPLPLAAGELVREAVAVLGAEPDRAQQLRDPLLPVGPVDAVDPQRLGDDLAHGHARVQRRVRVLEDDLDLAAHRPHVAAAETR